MRPNRAYPAAVVTAALVVVPAEVRAGADQYLWESALSGNWSCSTCWDPLGPPMVATDAARIDVTGPAYTITLNVNPAIEGLTLASADADLLVSGAATVMTVLSQQPPSQSVILAGTVDLRSSATWITGRGFRINGPESILELRTGATVQAESVILENQGRILAANGTSDLVCTAGIHIDPDAEIRIAATEVLRFDVGTSLAGGPVVVENTGQLRVVNLAIDPTGIVDLRGGYLRGQAATETLVNRGTVRGWGELGLNLLSISNESGGLIEVDTSTMDLNVNDDGMTNRGVVRARDDGRLRIQTSVIDNALGTIEALDGSFVDITASPTRITGGTLRTEGSGRIRDDTTTTADLDGVTIDGTFEVLPGSVTRLRNTITNQGTILVSAPGTTQLTILGEVTLLGGGTIETTDNGLNVITGSTGGHLINEDNTISAVGVLSNMSVTNRGLIVGSHPAGLDIMPGAGNEIRNEGEIVADGPGMVELSGPTIDNTGGVIRAEDGSSVILNGNTSITGGMLRTVGTGVIQDQTTTNHTQLVNVVNEGHYDLRSGAETRLVGTFTNSGLVTLTPESVTELKISGDIVIDGGGDIEMLDNGVGYINATSSGHILTNADNTIHGRGHIGLDIMSFVNQGTIVADSAAGVIRFDPPNDGFFENQGSLRAIAAPGFQIKRGPFTTSGEVFIAAGSKLERDSSSQGDYVQTGGTTVVDGVLRVASGRNVIVDGGTLGGSGTVEGNLFDNAGVAPGSSPGVLAVTGDYDQSIGGSLVIEIAGLAPGTGHDQLVIDGAAALDGLLVLEALDGYEPHVDDEFVVLTAAGGITGGYPCVDVVAFGALYAVLTNDGTSLTATVVATAPAEGDVTMNGVVNFEDLLAVLGGWGKCEHACCPGDANGSGRVDFQDVLVVLAGWDS